LFNGAQEGEFERSPDASKIRRISDSLAELDNARANRL